MDTNCGGFNVVEPGCVQLWHGALDVPAPGLQWLRTVLEPAEQVRADRFVFERHRNRFVAARGMLRCVLAGYLGTAPADVRFEYREHGKPDLAGDRTLRFNISHSEDRALLAVTTGCEVGVDIEAVRTDWAPDDVARRFFSPHECAWLYALPAEMRRAAFFRIWSRKEAYIKAHGLGLSMGLDSFDVAVDERPGNCLVATRPRETEAGEWWISGLDAPAGFAAAVATRTRKAPRLEEVTWTHPACR